MDKGFSNKDGVAIKGYDPVAYFVNGVATKGSQKYTETWGGAIWWFETEENRAAFSADPDSFAPAFGGYCSAGKALHIKIKGSPKQWKVEDGQLYLQSNVVSHALHGALEDRIHQLAGPTEEQ